ASKASARAATSADHSPRLCPATASGVGPTVSSSTRYAAMLAVRIAGCAYSVSTSRSSGPSKHKRESAIPSRSSASANVRRATGRIGDDVGRSQRVVRATLVALARRRSALGYGHLFLRRVRSLPAHERVQDGEPPVGRHLLAVARTRVQVCAAA